MFLLETTSIKVQTTGLQNSLKSGSFVDFTVNKNISPNFYQISLLGKFITVKSSGTLQLGSRIHAQIFWIENKLELKVVGNKNLSNSNIDYKDSFTDPVRKLISEGLIRTNMSLDPSYFDKILSVLKKYKKIDHKLIKILLLMIDKGIPLSETNINGILSFSGNLDSKNSEKHERKSQSKESVKVDKESIRENIKNQIKKMDSGSELIKYFNHSVGKHDNWLIIPLSFDYLRTGHGVLKLKLNDDFSITNLVLTLDDGNNWEFNFIKSKKGGTMKISGPDDSLWKQSSSFIKLK
ncbi:MAG: hypothetical protein PF693_20580, partial [Spirochaetia bacterium]|nr:hypothetical protein [Spirochaetia bacterium]